MSLALGATERPDVPARLRAGAAALLARQHGRFAPWLAVALGAGVLLYFRQPTEPGLGALFLAVPLAGLAALVSRHAPLTGWAVALLAAFCLGFGIAAWHAERLPPPLDLPRGAVQLTGQVTEVEALPEGQRVTLQGVRIAGGDALPRSIRIRLRANDPARPMPGDSLAARVLLREPGGPVVPGAWDFGRAAYFSGLGGSGTALGPVAVTSGGGEWPVFALLRARLEAKVEAAIPGAAGAVAAALLTGSQAAIPPAEIAAMRDSGLAHLLSVSGLHMTIVMGAVFGVLRLAVALVPWLALRVNGKAVAAMGALLAGLAYTLLTGAQVPMQRCLVMAALVTLGLLAGRRALTVRTLALAAAAVLLVAPAEVLGPSFQMSFAAVLALAAGWEALRGRLPAPGSGWRRRLALAAFGLVVTSVLAGAATTPFGLHHFGRLQIYGVAANALAVPITSLLVMPAGMIALLLMPLGLEGPALWAMGEGVEAILAVAAQVASWPEAAPVLAPLPGAALAVMSFGFCWLALWRGALRLVGVPIMAGALAAGLSVPPPNVLMTGDARLVALRTAQGVYLHALPGASAFARSALLRQMGVEAAQPLPAQGEAAEGAIACTPVACRFRPRPGGPEAVLFRTAPPARGQRSGEPPDRATLAEACGRAALLIATEPLRRRCPGSIAIDRFTVWREGAQAVRFSTNGVTVVSERSARGERPWVPAPPVPGRPDPQAQAPRDSGG
ncbi:ComEC/Rec2 family competence protein [Roseomonas sp. AR75]|uniref:ComEC/Rec2 family competence protein n=1 Tax=Roseomonas sp. AR75 TaxID=2562311 RepID=UPI001F106A1C|nr:ComEC/Rec2 family competence protein [Roseomonas sp. AR75]